MKHGPAHPAVAQGTSVSPALPLVPWPYGEKVKPSLLNMEQHNNPTFSIRQRQRKRRHQESKCQCKNEMITLSLCLALPFLKHQTYSGAFKNHWQLKMSVWLTNQKNVNIRALNCIIWVNMYLYSLERKALLFNCWTAAATQELFWFIMQIMQFGTPIMGIKNAK